MLRAVANGVSWVGRKTKGKVEWSRKHGKEEPHCDEVSELLQSMSSGVLQELQSSPARPNQRELEAKMS